MPAPHGLHLRRGDDLTPSIDALAAAHGGRVGAGVLGDLNRTGRRAWAPGRAVEKAWTFDCVDRRDLRWWPQGVDVRGSTVALTWYAKKLPGDDVGQGARVTFFDLDTARYRHVLLVQPTLVDGVAGVAPLPVHAGGLVWAGEHLHVAATAKGFWSARLDDVVRVTEDVAFGYRYLLPVHTAWRASADDGVERLRYSFLSRDGDDLLAGEWAAGASSRRLATVPLDPATHLPTGDPEVLGDGVGHMQGVVRVDGRFYATTSHGRSRLGSVWTGSPGALTRHRWAIPMGPEDLTWDEAHDRLWSVTEHPWARWIYSMKRSWFD